MADQRITPTERQDALREAADMGDARLGRYTLFEQYYQGDQQSRLTDRARRYLEQHDIPFNENFCETVIDVMCDRMTLVGFNVEDDQSEDGTAAEGAQTAAGRLEDVLKDWTSRDAFDERQGVVHTQTAIKGDGFVIVEWDADAMRPRFRFNRPEIIKPVYMDDDPETLDYVVKVWPQHADLGVYVGTILRMNLYFPDRLEKWYCLAANGSSPEAMWHPWQDEDDKGWPVSWLRPDGTPRGIQVIPFRNKSKGKTYGRSELRGVIPQQDALTKTLLDLFEVDDAQGWPQRYVTGVNPDATVSLRSAPGEVWKLPEGATAGQFDPADPTKLLDVLSAQLRRIAARSRTPMHDLLDTGDQPSGEARKASESGLVSKVKDREVSHGNSWVRVMEMGVKLANDFGGMNLDESLLISAQWDDPQTRNEKDEADTAAVWHDSLGVSARTLQSRHGFDPDVEAEQRAIEDGRAIDNGTAGGGLPPETLPPDVGSDLTPGAPVPA